MVSLTPGKVEKADLFTNSQALETLLHNEAPFAIFPPQYSSERISETETMYRFVSLPCGDLTDWLDEIDPSLRGVEYEMRDHASGDILRIRTPQKLITDAQEVEKYLKDRFGI